MIEVYEEEFKSNKKKYDSLIEKGEDILVRRTDGTAYIATDVTKFEHQLDQPICDI
tara:strand:+ start:3627 stop:3794 length:168 start_codon:yes stop_codon:yes gene_type:complete